MERCQIDLVFEKKPTKDENENIYKYVLSCLDFFHGTSFLEDRNQKTQLNKLTK